MRLRRRQPPGWGESLQRLADTITNIPGVEQVVTKTLGKTVKEWSALVVLDGSELGFTALKKLTAAIAHHAHAEGHVIIRADAVLCGGELGVIVTSYQKCGVDPETVIERLDATPSFDERSFAAQVDEAAGSLMQCPPGSPEEWN